MINVADILTAIGAFVEDHEGALTALATIAIATFTWTLYKSTDKLWKETKAASKIAQTSATAALKNAQAVEATERAYVKISHCPPGLVFSDLPGICSVQIKIHNLGNTPARITDVVISRLIQPETSVLPAIPRYETRDKREESFLYKDDPFYFIRRFTLADSDRDGMQNGSIKFYLYGYVDYIDQFGTRHRSGYGRQFDPHGNPDNLKFLTQPGYNYDRPRKQDEGRDWDEEPI